MGNPKRKGYTENTGFRQLDKKGVSSTIAPRETDPKNAETNTLQLREFPSPKADVMVENRGLF
jgi:hypothetical protein